MWFLNINRLYKKLKLGLKFTTVIIVNLVFLEPVIAEKTPELAISNRVDLVKIEEAETNVINPIATEMNSGKLLEPSVIESVDSVRAAKIDSYNAKDESEVITQIPSVSQLRDVRGSDWAFQALESLVEQHDCIDRYPNNTYQSSTILTRYEFAAQLNVCLERIKHKIESATANLNQDDLTILQKLQSEFSTELANLKDRVDSLEFTTAKLENERFSTTARLSGTAVFSGVNYFSGEGENQFVFQQETFLRLSASFTGRDMLSLVLEASNTDTPELVTTNSGREFGSTTEGLTTLSNEDGNENNFVLSNAEYIFPIIDNEHHRWFVTIAAISGFNTSASLLPRTTITWEGYEQGTGPVSTFAQRSPLYFLAEETGIITNYDRGPWRLTLVYLATEASDPSDGAGLFNGDYSSLVQLNFTPIDRLALAFTYSHNYSTPGQFAYGEGSGSIGTSLANSFDNEGVFFDKDIPVSSNNYGIQGFFQVSPKLVIGGFVAKTDARLIGHGDADIWTYAVNLTFPDLGKEGNLGGLIVGMEPTLTSLNAVGVSSEDFERDTSLHVEAYYRHQISDNISITPGVIWLTAPNQDADNQDIVEGVIRTTFSF